MAKIVYNNKERDLTFNGWSFSELIFNFSIIDNGETYEEIQNEFSGIKTFSLTSDDLVIPLNNYTEVQQISKITNGYVDNNGQFKTTWNITCMKVTPMVEPIIEE